MLKLNRQYHHENDDDFEKRRCIAENTMHPFLMTEGEYENIWRNHYKMKKDQTKDSKRYQLSPDK